VKVQDSDQASWEHLALENTKWSRTIQTQPKRDGGGVTSHLSCWSLAIPLVHVPSNMTSDQSAPLNTPVPQALMGIALQHSPLVQSSELPNRIFSKVWFRMIGLNRSDLALHFSDFLLEHTMSHLPCIVTDDYSGNSNLMEPVVQSKVCIVLEFHWISSDKVEVGRKDLTIFVASQWFTLPMEGVGVDFSINPTKVQDPCWRFQSFSTLCSHEIPDCQLCRPQQR
jgi:hypothetical protein